MKKISMFFKKFMDRDKTRQKKSGENAELRFEN